MAKKDDSGLKAGFTKRNDVRKEVEIRRQAQERKAAVEAAQKAKEEAALKAAEASEAAKADTESDDSEEAAGPTITMQGVSGKNITSTVKVVKRKKAPKAETVEPSEEPAAETEPQEEPAAADAAQTVRTEKPEPVEEAIQLVEDVLPAPESVKQEVEEAAPEPAPLPAAEKQPEPVPVKTEKAAEAKAETKSVEKPVKRRQTAPAAKQPAGKKPAAAQKTESARDKTANQPVSGTTLHSPTPRKLGNIYEQQKAEEARKAELAAKAEAKNKKPQQSAQAPPAAKANKPAEPGPDAPNRGQGPTREARPANILNRAQPGKVGNIFDGKDSVSGADSSLAATAAAFAQRKKRQEQARQESRGKGQGRGAASYGGRSTSRGAARGTVPDKDADTADSRSQYKRRPAKRKQTEFVSKPTESSGRNFSKRDAIERTKRQGGARRDAVREQKGFETLRQQLAAEERGQAKQTGSGVTHVALPETLTVKEFAEAIKTTSAEVIKELMKFGVMATLNEQIDYDTASIIAAEFGISTEQFVEVTDEEILFDESEDAEEDLEPRAPVVVVMGHVDHGKTSLLDYIRNAEVAEGEAGGITQHIGAYMVRVNDRKITFLDTPGHEAFTTMRQRGAQVTDIAILVVAADDGVMPQTIEAIRHAQAAETEIIVAINKIDKPGAEPERVKQQLSQYDLIPEDWGGKTIMVPVSAKTGEGVDELLEMVLLTADIMDLKANPNRQAKGTVVEARLDKNRGAVATILVQRGTLRQGDTLVTGSIVGNVRAMNDANGKPIKKAGPSVPVEIIGLPEAPEAGEPIYAVDDEHKARQLAERRREQQREESINQPSKLTLDNLYSRMSAGEVQELNLIIKADVQGSVEALQQSLVKLSNDDVKVNVIHGAVGAINESDIRLASVSNAIVIGFNVRHNKSVSDMADDAGVDIRLYSVIYNAIEDIEAAMKGMLAPEFKEVVLGHAEIRETFKVSNIGTIGGAYVTDGKIVRNALVRLTRNGIVINEGRLGSLRRFKDDVREVAQGYECGLSIENFNDIKVGDVVEAYEMQEVSRDGQS